MLGSDKQFYVMVGFIALVAIFAAVIGSGALNTIVQTGEKVDNTNILLQQRIALSKQQDHEDEQRQMYELKAEARQEKLLLENELSNKYIIGNITQLISDSDKRSNISNVQRAATLNQTKEILNNLEQKTKDHDIMSQNMNKMQFKLNNITEEILDVLNKFGSGNRQLGIDNKSLLENLTKNVEEIKVVVRELSTIS